MRKFNLDEALAGHPVVTGDNRKVKSIVYHRDIKTDHPVHVFIEEKRSDYKYDAHEIESYTVEGIYSSDGTPSDEDLFMSSSKYGWVNIYQCGKIEGAFNSQAEATYYHARNQGHLELITTKFIEWEAN